MIAMQYRVALPADYDMDVIRRRVATTGHLLDHYPGLGVKAFLMRERGHLGATANEYAPFYLWNDAAGAASFLWSGVGFSAIVRDFGRPAVDTWIGGTARSDAGDVASATHAVRTTRELPADTDLAAAAASADAALARRFDDAEVPLVAYGIDPTRWQLMTFSLHRGAPEVADGDAEVFELLHVAAPEVASLPTQVEPRIVVP